MLLTTTHTIYIYIYIYEDVRHSALGATRARWYTNGNGHRKPCAHRTNRPRAITGPLGRAAARGPRVVWSPTFAYPRHANLSQRWPTRAASAPPFSRVGGPGEKAAGRTLEPKG